MIFSAIIVSLLLAGICPMQALAKGSSSGGAHVSSSSSAASSGAKSSSAGKSSSGSSSATGKSSGSSGVSSKSTSGKTGTSSVQSNGKSTYTNGLISSDGAKASDGYKGSASSYSSSFWSNPYNRTNTNSYYYNTGYWNNGMWYWMLLANDNNNRNDDTEHLISFDAGTHGTASFSSEEKKAGESISMPIFTSSDGYLFLGWVSQDGSESNVAGDSDVTLYAKTYEEATGKTFIGTVETDEAMSYDDANSAAVNQIAQMNGQPDTTSDSIHDIGTVVLCAGFLIGAVIIGIFIFMYLRS